MFRIQTIPVLKDNYTYLLIDAATQRCLAIDPVKPQNLIPHLSDLELKGILTTHHHWDHAGGNLELLNKNRSLLIYGSDERIPGLNVKVHHNQPFQFESIQITPLFTPCHTSGSVSFLIQDGKNSPAVFTGDTLFMAGCGRFFEGTAKEMVDSLSILGKLDPSTRVFCGHEYTRKNLEFAKTIEPLNQDIQETLEWSLTRDQTVPSTIGQELKINPFLRIAVNASLSMDEKVSEMARVRALKDQF